MSELVSLSIAETCNSSSSTAAALVWEADRKLVSAKRDDEGQARSA
jgi:hypothetical protein